MKRIALLPLLGTHPTPTQLSMLSWTVYPLVFSERKERTANKEKLIVKVRKNNHHFELFLVFSDTDDELDDVSNVSQRGKRLMKREHRREGQS